MYEEKVVKENALLNVLEMSQTSALFLSAYSGSSPARKVTTHFAGLPSLAGTKVGSVIA